MASLFLINAPHSQKIKTVESYQGTPLVYSNPGYYQNKIQLAADFNLISIGDKVVICSHSEFKFIALVERVELLTDATGSEEYDGSPVKVLFGSVISRFGRKVKAFTACNRFESLKVDTPRLLNSKVGGFKQGAFAERLSDVQATEVLSWVA